ARHRRYQRRGPIYGAGEFLSAGTPRFLRRRPRPLLMHEGAAGSLSRAHPLGGIPMLRLSGLKLPLDHPAEAMPAAICERLRIAPHELLNHVVVRRGNDARRKNAIQLVYTIDVELADEAVVLERLAKDHDVRLRPDTDYKFVA